MCGINHFVKNGQYQGMGEEVKEGSLKKWVSSAGNFISGKGNGKCIR